MAGPRWAAWALSVGAICYLTWVVAAWAVPHSALGPVTTYASELGRSTSLAAGSSARGTS